MRQLICSLLLLLAALSVAPEVAAGVKCSCPKVAADGEGNTSCSAAESNGRCAIDFNVFFEREQRAESLLIRTLRGVRGYGQLNTPDPRASAQDALLKAKGSSDRVRDTVLIYLTVALSALAEGGGTDAQAAVPEIAEALREQSARVNEAFDPSLSINRQFSPQRLTVGSTSMVIGTGCIEVLTRTGVWVMFKANFSPSASYPRCAEGQTPR